MSKTAVDLANWEELLDIRLVHSDELGMKIARSRLGTLNHAVPKSGSGKLEARLALAAGSGWMTGHSSLIRVMEE